MLRRNIKPAHRLFKVLPWTCVIRATVLHTCLVLVFGPMRVSAALVMPLYLQQAVCTSREEHSQDEGGYAFAG